MPQGTGFTCPSADVTRCLCSIAFIVWASEQEQAPPALSGLRWSVHRSRILALSPVKPAQGQVLAQSLVQRVRVREGPRKPVHLARLQAVTLAEAA